MLYETRRALLGFRLKLTFDESLNKDMSCIFVDVSKTATVGLLLNNIIERFQIPHNSFLTVQNCRVLPSESVYVLLDVNSVKINGPSTSTAQVRRTQSSDVSQENAAYEANEQIPCDEGDVVDGKTKAFLKPRPPKRPIREGIAATIKMLLEEKEMDQIGKECSELNLSNDMPKIESTSHQETMKVDDDKAETNLHAEELSDFTSDAYSDLNIEKKKRKRKRKHTKNHEVGDQPASSFSFDEPVPKLRLSINNTQRKHIRFVDGDDEGQETLNQSCVMETGDVSTVEIRSFSDDQSSRKSTKNQIKQSTPTTNGTSSNCKYNYNQDESYHRPKSSFSPCNGKRWSLNSQTDSDNSVSSFINLPRLSESENKEYKPKHDRVEKELATLLMCKQLNTSMEYTVQFANEKGKCYPSTSPSSSKDYKDSPIHRLPVCEPCWFPKKSSASNLISQNIKAEGNHENGLPEQMEASSDDCEFLKQVKLDGTRIRLRKPDGTWTVLTPEIANTELPKLDVPKESQSIVFRIVYLNRNFNPTLSELLYGQIVVTNQPNPNKLALDIPHQFVEAIAKDCEDEVLPETIVPITGSTFQVDLSALVEPKVIS